MKCSVLLSLMLFLLVQVPAGTLSQRTARKQLKHMGLAFPIDYHTEPCIRAQAAWVILNIERKQARETLQAAFKTEDNDFVRSQLAPAIERIEQSWYWPRDVGH